MARKKTSAEKAREDAENEKVENMLDGAFGTLSGLETNKPEENLPEETTVIETNLEEIQEENQEESRESTENEEMLPEEQDEIVTKSTDEETISEEDPAKEEVGTPELMPENPVPISPPSKGPPSGPPSGPPTKGPPTKGPPTKGPPTKGPPSGPPSKGPPSNPPNDKKEELIEDKAPSEEESILETESTESDAEIVEEVMESTEMLITDQKVTDLPEEQDVVENEEPSNQEVETANDEMEQETIEELVEVPEVIGEEYAETISHPEIPVEGESDVTTNVETEAAIARLNAEVERLRRSMAGAAEVIEELENPPMPPAVMDNLVIGAHIIGDMARLARQLDREQLIRASMGTIAMLHPDQLEIIVSTKHMALLPRMDERDICAAKLGVDPPRGAPADWRVLEVVLASVSLITGGPAAVIHSHGPFTTAASCEKDLVLVQPIDQIGKKHIGKIIIVDPDDDNPEEFLRQVAEALQQGGMRCVVIRGMGAYAVGADLDQAWANAAMLEHSMKIVLLARQANLKV